MKLWIGGEIEADIADAFRASRSRVETTINSAIEGKEYNVAFCDWDVIAIVRKDTEFAEIHTYSRKQKEMDFRLRVDCGEFEIATPLEQERMIFAMLMRSLRLLQQFDVGDGILAMLADVNAAGEKQGWHRQG